MVIFGQKMPFDNRSSFPWGRGVMVPSTPHPWTFPFPCHIVPDGVCALSWMFQFSADVSLMAVSILVRLKCGRNAVCWVSWLRVLWSWRLGKPPYRTVLPCLTACLSFIQNATKRVCYSPSLKCNQGKCSCRVVSCWSQRASQCQAPSALMTPLAPVWNIKKARGRRAGRCQHHYFRP